MSFVDIPDVQAGIFAGESGGDYDALWNFSNRPGHIYSHIKPTEMTLNQWLAFQEPSGAYGTYVGATNPDGGRVATPMGGYQIVGTTLRDAKQALGLKGDEVMTPAMQDKIGRWIYDTQGTGAWAGYKGPQSGGTMRMTTSSNPTEPPLTGMDYLTSPDTLARLKLAAGSLTGPRFRDRAGMAIAQQQLSESADRQERKAVASRTMDILRQMGAPANVIAMAEVDPQGALRLAMKPAKEKGRVVTAEQLRAMYPGAGEIEDGLYNIKSDGTANKVGGGGTTVNVDLSPAAETFDKEVAKELSSFLLGGGADAQKNLMQLTEVRDRLRSGEENLTGPFLGAVPRSVRVATGNSASVNVQEKVEEVVQRNLKEILGAQFTEKEGERLISRAYNPQLSEEQNAERLDNLIRQMQLAYEAKASAALYFQQNQTLVGWEGKMPTMADFSNALDGWEEAGDGIMIRKLP